MTHAHLHRLVVEGGYASWRRLALRALAYAWPPETITWTERTATGGAAGGQMTLDALQDEAAGPPRDAPALPRVRISRNLAALLHDAALYRSPGRWPLLYRVVWRWHQGDRAVASAADEDGARLHAMAKSVRRAKHDMIAYLRFKERADGGSPQYLAWYEPEHDVLPFAAEHFAQRMGASTWWIGTPHGAAWWDGRDLHISEATLQATAMPITDDEVEPLWLAYYQNTFNPARLNECALERQMPVRFWRHLPEGPLIPRMVAEARDGARRLAQSGAIGTMPGKPVAVEAARAQPLRAPASSLDQCRRCELWRHATQPVPGCGPANARLMLVGEQPGDHEDLSGRVFIGPAGKVLDDAMRRAGVARESVYLTNAIKHFKWIARGKRRLHKTPAQREVEACSRWLREEMVRVRPAVIVTLGATALRAVLGPQFPLRDHLGMPLRQGDAWVVPTWHPSYALRASGAEKEAAIIDDIVRAIAHARELASTD